jgi:DNA-binding beta-propeller fold protein YncE
MLSTIFSLMTTLALPTLSNAIQASFLYALSDFTGPFLIGGGRMFVDKERNEAYIVYQNVVRVFNENGLEIYRFNEDNSLGRLTALTVDRDGTIFFLSYNDRGEYGIIRCNYRGEPTGRIEVGGLPPDFANYQKFSPNYMAYREGQFYLADGRTLRIAVADKNGQVQKTYDLIPLFDLKEKDRADLEMGGFSVDSEGNMLFTVPVLFSATVLSPEGVVKNFGQPGSIPGKFGVASGIVRDNKENILVADKLKCVISVFDSGTGFLTEFGGRGNEPDSLIVPDVLAVDGSDKVYVTQGANRGVSVFRLIYN